MKIGKLCVVIISAIAALYYSTTGFTDTGETLLFNAEYQGKYSGMTIKSSRKLYLQENGQLRIESKIKNFMASIEERSDFSLNNGILQPHYYHYKRKIMAFKADEKLSFDWEKNVAQYRRKDKPEKNRDHAIELGILDPVLYQLQLQRELYSGHDDFSFTFVKPSKVKTLLFKKTGDETLKVGDKTYPAIKVERINLDDEKQTRIWLIPELNFQIAKIEHTEEDGNSYSIFLTGYTSHEKLLDVIYSKQPETSSSNTDNSVTSKQAAPAEM
ncbi:Protein of unknown function [Alteromonadaceae bacterium Bs31]|nr:Protein of unknown function [Alteromonadaceae bacterium Bs31]